MIFNNNSLCCSTMERITDEQPMLMQYGGKDPKTILFACRQINYCPFCGMHLTDRRNEKFRMHDFCCDGMESNVTCCDASDEFDIFYQPWARRYLFSMCKEWRYFQLECEEWDFYYCLHCGTKLPESLEKLWREVIEREFGVVPKMKSFEGIENTLKKLPEEFRTEQWWRERGL